MMNLKDEVIAYPERANTGQPVKDWMFNGVVHRYQKFNHPWKKSDQRVWSGFIYGVISYIGYIIFFALMWWVISLTQKRFGDARALFLILLILLVRVNILIKQIVILNKKF